jgi:uncharacterized membrane protein
LVKKIDGILGVKAWPLVFQPSNNSILFYFYEVWSKGMFLRSKRH